MAALALLEHGAELSPQNIDGQIPLHLVSQRFPCHVTGDVVRLLLERGMDVNSRDRARETPLHLASSKSWAEIVQVLLEYGADADARNADGQTPLHRVPQWEYYFDNGAEVVLQLLKHTKGLDVNTRDKSQETPLHLASYYLSDDVVEVLLDHGALVNAENIRRQIPLHQLVLGNHKCRIRKPNETRGLGRWEIKVVHTAQLLLERGAGVNAQDERLETPLHLASRLRLHEMARILLKHGANVDMKNSEGLTALQLASGRKGKAMRRLLLECSEKQTDT